MVDRASSGEPAAVLVEFVVGAGGIVPIPASLAGEVRRFCDERGALLIADEALTGLGRTGRWFAFEHTGVVPDMVVVSKALGSGVPAAAVITTRAVADAALRRGFVQAASHQGDPFQCAVALGQPRRDGGRGAPRQRRPDGTPSGEGLAGLAARHGIVGEARGIGLIVGGLRPGIREGSTLRLAPPLTVSEGEIDEALAILEAALTAVEADHHAAW
jgi:4-aminobutyrate aminotransferase-like enzyme